MSKRNYPEVCIYNPENIIELVREVGYAEELDDTAEFYVVGSVVNETGNWWSVSITLSRPNEVYHVDEVIWLNYLSRNDWMKIFNRLTEIDNDE